MNASNTTRSVNFSIISICQVLGELKDPDKATPVSLAASFSVVIASILTCPLSIFLNIMILLAFYTKATLRTKANVLLGAMVMNDLASGAVGCPLFLAKEIMYLMRRHPNCYLNLTLFNTVSPVSFILLTAVNCERFLGLKFPIWHRVHITKRRLVFVAVVSFLVGQSMSILRIFVEEIRVLMLFLVVACTAATFIFAALIWQVILQRNQEVRNQQQNQPRALATRSERKAAKIATYTALSFLFTRIIPLILMTSMLTNQDCVKYVAEPLTMGLYFMDVFINPLIYGLMNQNIKKACLEIIKCT